MDHTFLSIPTSRFRLRHLRLSGHRSTVRNHARLRPSGGRSQEAQYTGGNGSGFESYLGPASLVRGIAVLPDEPKGGLVCVARRESKPPAAQQLAVDFRALDRKKHTSELQSPYVI